MMKQTFFLDPLDVLLFRDGRPQVPGDSHLGQGFFPPPPTTLYGALRSAVMAHGGARFVAYDEASTPSPATRAFNSLGGEARRAAGSPDALGEMTLEHVLLAHRSGSNTVTALLPTGLDLARPKGDEEAVLLLRPVDESGTMHTSLPRGLRRLAPPANVGAFVEPLRGYLDVDAYTRYLCANPVPGVHVPDASPSLRDEDTPRIYGEEDRTSVSLDDGKGTAAEGLLFTTRYTRLRYGYGLTVTVRNAEGVPAEGVLRLGGEQRPVAYHPARPTLPDARRVQASVEGGRVRVVMATPAPFVQGWKPDFITDGLNGTLGGVPVRLVGTAVGRYQPLGGWDMAMNRPKPVRRAVPAGSVYFLQLDPTDVPALFDVAFGRSLFPSSSDDEKLGLGLAYLGAW